LALVELSVVEQRYRAVLEAASGVPVTEVAGKFGVSRQSVHAWIRRYERDGLGGLADRSRRSSSCPFRQMAAAPPPVPAVPKTRQITRWLLSDPDHLDPHEKAKLNGIRARCPHLDDLAGHVTAFAKMMTRRTGETDLEGWLARVEADEQSGLRSFAAGIRNDLQAVTNGLTPPYSSAACEGNVTRIKLIKRQMYGRASFGLLRKRVILHPG
jgi:transposase-like protein